MSNRLIQNKIDELIELAQIESERNVAIVLLILSGSIAGGQDGKLAAHLQEYVQKELVPECLQNLHDKNVLNN